MHAPWVFHPATPLQLWLPTQPAPPESWQILRQVLAKQPWPPAQSDVVLQPLPCVPDPVIEQAVFSLLSSQQPSDRAQPAFVTGSQALGSVTQVPFEQDVPKEQLPQLPPQPLSPQLFPPQLGVHTH